MLRNEFTDPSNSAERKTPHLEIDFSVAIDTATLIISYDWKLPNSAPVRCQKVCSQMRTHMIRFHTRLRRKIDDGVAAGGRPALWIGALCLPIAAELRHLVRSQTRINTEPLALFEHKFPNVRGISSLYREYARVTDKCCIGTPDSYLIPTLQSANLIFG